ncbi:MAG: TonB-dependent receptor, partial [Thermodesulfobacteriota bacterium]|nr:TonB-dependent receptor [Thermodesulfobacteriota bacterium]
KGLFLSFLILVIPGMLLTDDIKAGKSDAMPAESILKRELLLFEEIPMVVTAFKKPQKISDAPSAMYVITEKDIRQSGVLKLEDLFRLVPGMDVMSINRQTSGVSARGFNSEFANKLLVLIDGRSVYLPVFGGLVWNSLPLFMENIKQIEIMRGPGATLYGANAFNGVINIITKEPGEGEGNYISGTFGSNETRKGVYINEGRTNKIDYRFSAGYEEEEGYHKNDAFADFKRFPKATARVTYNLSNTSNLQFFGGILQGEQGQISPWISMLVEESKSEGLTDYEMLRYENSFSEHSDISLQLYRNELNFEISSLDVDTSTIDFEGQYSFDGGRNVLVTGGNVRRNYVKSTIFNDGEAVDEFEFGLFAQHEYRLLNNLSFVTGIKMQHSERIDEKFSPRFTILYTPVKNHVFRVSVGKAYRNPTIYEAFDTITLYPFPFPLSWLRLKSSGHRYLRPESIIAYELGYRSRLDENTNFSLELYLNEMNDLIEHIPVKYFPPGGQIIPLEVSPRNRSDARAMGIEVGISHYFFPWCKAFLNYTFQDIENTSTHNKIRSSPQNKLNGGIYCTFENGASFSCWASYVGKTATEPTMKGLEPSIRIGDYTRLDARIARTFMKNNLEIAIVGQNLLEGNHYEYPGVEVERMFFGTFSYKF